MDPAAGAAQLIRAVGLLADGPVLWARPVRSGARGVFVVELPVPAAEMPLEIAHVRVWVERVPEMTVDGEPATPGSLAARLREFWIPGQRVVYVGRAERSLGARVAALYRTPLGDAKPHAGGHWLKTLSGLEVARIWWAETEAPEEYEDALLTEFARGVSPEAATNLPRGSAVLPFANLSSPTSGRKRHGLVGSLRTEDQSQPPAPPAQRATGARSPAPRSPARGSQGTGSRPAAVTRRSPAVSPGARPRAAPKPRSTSSTGAPAAPPVHLTADGLARLQEELRELTADRRPEVVARVKAARELGDLRENADYEAARNEQSFLEGRIRMLEGMLRNVAMIDDPSAGATVVRLGSTVRVEALGEEQRFTIVGSTEADPRNGRISSASPVGQALLGLAAGDEVTVPLPTGEVRYRVLEIA